MTGTELVLASSVEAPRWSEDYWVAFRATHRDMYRTDRRAFGLDYFDRQGRPISMGQWLELLERGHMAYKQIGLTRVGAHAVSTIWLGTNHDFSFTQGAPPVIFESMVFFDGDEDERYGLGASGIMLRYCTEAEARQGHRSLVGLLRMAVDEWTEHGRSPLMRALRQELDDEPVPLELSTAFSPDAMTQTFDNTA